MVSALGHILMLSQFHKLSRQQALILERPTLHTPLFGLCLLAVAWDAGSLKGICNILGTWNVFHCKSIGLHSKNPSLDPKTGLGFW